MMYLKRLPLTLLALLATALLAFGACGGDDDDDDTGNGGDEPTEITIEMGERDGANYFEPDEFSVGAGTTVAFITENVGEVIHNMRIAGPDNRYMTEDDAATDDFVDPGASAAFTWDVPDEPGEYKFQCDIHPTDMVGTIAVE